MPLVWFYFIYQLNVVDMKCRVEQVVLIPRSRWTQPVSISDRAASEQTKYLNAV